MSEEKNAGTDVVPAAGRVVTSSQIEDAGLMMPLADPSALRAAFAERQRVLTSILDPERDFLYSIRYFDRDGKQRQMMCNTLTEAKAAAKHVNGTYSAHPKKSGVLKLAHALGIEATRMEVKGLPDDPRATFSACRYIAKHRRTGRQEEGQGYCDKAEQQNRQAHAIISMADTRAYVHAVLRCAGYDNVGAEEMELDDSLVTTLVVTTIQSNLPADRPAERPAERERPALSASTAPTTLADVMPAAASTPEPATVSRPVERPAAQAAQAAPTTTAPTTAASSEAEPPMEGRITKAMAAELSALLLGKLGSRDRASEWLVANAGVARSIYVQEAQFGTLKKALEALEAP